MTLELTIQLTLLFVSLVAVGTLLCLPLYGWSVQRLVGSELFTKIIWWTPIYAVFLAILLLQNIVALLVTIGLLFLAAREFIANAAQKSRVAVIYAIFFTIVSLHLALWFCFVPDQSVVKGLVVVCMASVLSDVCAFFCGKYVGRHHLPVWLNARKSWEGVVGQIIGAFIGAGLVLLATDISAPFILVLMIGSASAVGDLFNSAAKRSLDIKDWGTTIPGHGGVLDRFSSLSTAVMTSFWLLILTSGISL